VKSDAVSLKPPPKRYWSGQLQRPDVTVTGSIDPTTPEKKAEKPAPEGGAPP